MHPVHNQLAFDDRMRVVARLVKIRQSFDIELAVRRGVRSFRTGDRSGL